MLFSHFRFKATDMATTERCAQLRIDVPLEIGEIYPAKLLWRSILEAPMNGLAPFEERMSFHDKIPNAKMGSYAILFLVDLATAQHLYGRLKGKVYGGVTAFNIHSGESNRPMYAFPQEVIFKYRM